MLRLLLLAAAAAVVLVVGVQGAGSGLQIRVGADSLPIVTDGRVSPVVATVNAVSGLPVPGTVSAIDLKFYGLPGSKYKLHVKSSDRAILPHPKYSIPSSGSMPTSPTTTILDFNCTQDGTALLTTTWEVIPPGGGASVNSTYYAYKECASIQSSCAACGDCIVAGECTCAVSTAGSNCIASTTGAQIQYLADDSLKLLVWNTYGVGLTESDDQTAARYDEIADYILKSGAHVIALEEIFTSEVRDLLVRRLRKTYPYMSQQSFGNGPSRFSGLLFASQFPIVQQAFEEFSQSVPASSDSLTDKGVYGALVQYREDGYIYVFHTHMQASEGKPATVRAVQSAQLRQIRSFIGTSVTSISSKYPSSQVMVTLVGDLNGGGDEGTSSLKHSEIMEFLRYPRDLYLEQNAEATEKQSIGTCTAQLQAQLVAAGRPSCTLGQEVMVDVSRLDYAMGFNDVDTVQASPIKLLSAVRTRPTSPDGHGLNLGSGDGPLSDHPAYQYAFDVSVDHTDAIVAGVVIGVILLALVIVIALAWTGKIILKIPATLETYLRQTKILLTKNFLMSIRNRQALIVQLLVPIVFVAVLFLLQFAIRSNEQRAESIAVRRHSPATPIPRIPRCVVGPGQSSCYTFGYTPSGNSAIDELMETVRAANSIPKSEVISFTDPDAADVWLDSHRNTTQGVYHLKPVFGTYNGKQIIKSVNYTIQYNTTVYQVRRVAIVPISYIVQPMQNALDSALITLQYGLSHPGAPDLTVSSNYIPYPHPELFTVDVVGQQGPIFFLGCLMFNFVTQLGQIVTEKELHLRDALATMGMRTSLYWFTWAIINMFWNLISALLLIAAGAAFQFSFFLKNDFLTYFILFLLFGFAMVPLAFFCSLAISRARTATSLGFGIYLLGIMIQGAAPLVFIESDDTATVALRTVLSFMPFALLSKGMRDLGSFTDNEADKGMRWSERDSYAWFTLQSVYKWCIVSFFTFLVLAVVCDFLFVSSHGESRASRWWHLLLHRLRRRDTQIPQDPDVADEAVAAEEADVQAGKFAPTEGIQVLGLRKVFAGGFVAVRKMWLHIQDRQLFCLLGHNGAGKTTTLSMMVGLLQASAGDVNVFGNSLNDMESIQQIMGVCPQHDVLWTELTAAEHIELFAGLKGVAQAQVAAEVTARLSEVGLTKVGTKFAGEFSGGMRRRLSVAIALTGNPRVVYLDEPTTGMDPVSRRQVWDLLEAQKRKRLVVLTTHSMEEADVLSDRIAIMKQGRLHCIGTSVRLKHRFGSGLRVSVLLSDHVAPAPIEEGPVDIEDETTAEASVAADGSGTGTTTPATGSAASETPAAPAPPAEPPTPLEAVQSLIHSTVPDAAFSKAERGVAHYVIPKESTAALTNFLREVEANAASHGVQDVQVGLTTLEDVFLTVTGAGRTEGVHRSTETADGAVIPIADADPTVSSADAASKRTQFSWRAQFHALLTKSALLQGRQKMTNAFQLVLPLVLIIGLFVLQTLIDSIVADQVGEYTEPVLHPPLIPRSFLIPAVDFDPADCPKTPRGFVVDSSVGQLLYTSNGNAGIQAALGSYGPPVPGDQSQFWVAADAHNSFGSPAGLLGNVTRSQQNMFGVPGETYPRQGNRQVFCINRPRVVPITFTEIRSKNDLEDQLFGLWQSSPRAAGFVFESLAGTSPPVLNYSVLYNATLTQGLDVPHVNNLITNAVFRFFSPVVPSGVSLDYSGTRSMPIARTKNTFDLVSLIGPNVYLFLYQLLFPVFLGTLVYEKEFKLRDIMRMMGLKTSVYWVVNYLVFLVMYMVATLAFEILGIIVNFNYFVRNDFGLIVLFSFVWGNVLVAGAIFTSVFFTNARTATVVGYCIIFAAGIIGSSMVRILFDNLATPRATIFGLCVVPPFALLRGLFMFRDGVAFSSPGISFADVGQEGVELDSVMWFMVVQWIVAMVSAWYSENVFASSGIRASPLFFLQSSYWFSKPVDVSNLTPATVTDEPKAVAKERADVWSGSRQHDTIRILDLQKTFPSRRAGQPETKAVANLTMAVQRGECFGMLGPNGSGKTTTINCLCGYLAPSGGTATVAGYNIHGDTDLIHLNMGVCPQENVLWPELTGAEHLRFYGRLKDLVGPALEREVQWRLRQVELDDVGNKKAGQYSGGMQRRLCVAIALMGSPPVLLLDEPTTGLDPAARRTLWSVVETAKPNCATLLTTHSMEEAEALCERIGMFVFGKMKCLGTAPALKNELGDFYKLTVISSPETDAAIAQFVAELLPAASLLTEPIGGIRHYQCPRATTTLSTLIQSLEENWERLGISDWAVTNITLEEVFLKVTHNSNVATD